MTQGDRIRQPAEGSPAREIPPEELEFLRSDEGWAPAAILERLGPAADDSEHLARLMVAFGVLLGPHRMVLLCDRLIFMMTRSVRRLAQMVDDPSLSLKKDELEDLRKRVVSGLEEIGQTRARAEGDSGVDGAIGPDGLRFIDLQILVDHIRSTVEASEVVVRRNVAGVEFGFRYARAAPDCPYAKEWVERLFGTDPKSDLVLFWPPDYGRVVLVHRDGLLAYDPGEEPED